MTVKITEELLFDLIKDYFKDNDLPDINLEEGDVFNFTFGVHCIEGMTFVVYDIEVPVETAYQKA